MLILRDTNDHLLCISMKGDGKIELTMFQGDLPPASQTPLASFMVDPTHHPGDAVTLAGWADTSARIAHDSWKACAVCHGGGG